MRRFVRAARLLPLWNRGRVERAILNRYYKHPQKKEFDGLYEYRKCAAPNLRVLVSALVAAIVSRLLLPSASASVVVGLTELYS